MELCSSAQHLHFVLTAVFQFLISALTVYLVHRRRRADQERMWFYRQMREKHGLDHGEKRQIGPPGKSSPRS